MKLVMNGALGRMGRRIITIASEDTEIMVSGAVEFGHDEDLGRDVGEIIGIGHLDVPLTNDLLKAVKNADVVIDFTWPDNILITAAICGQSKTPLVIGTTGLASGKRGELERLVSPIPCVMAPNMSVGVNLLFKLAAEAAAILGEDYDVEITEAHHRFKKDAPSGTAVRLAEIVAGVLDRNLEQEARYGRKGISGERTRSEIGIHALRIGDVVGEHTVSFGTVGERVELTHKAQSRDALAQGALRAARFVLANPPGLYDMQDVLGFK
ncbi:4-hydroxy-tetrahydrodipicolinate reductase [bacterium]|nr:4-hydroxy-tetrahydrodipicolinate reductase [bacterium]